MRLTHSLLWASCLSSTALASKLPFDHGVIVEYEDWAEENNAALVKDVKATLGSSAQVDTVDVKPRIEISSSIFRGLSFNVTGMGVDVTTTLVQSKIQNLRVVKNVSPIGVLYTTSPIGAVPYFGPPIADSTNAQSGVAARQENTKFSTHVMTGVDKVHAAGIKGKGITIAIMDTGFDYKQDALGNSIGPGNKVTYGHDWVGDAYDGNNPKNAAVADDDPYADCSVHGTHVFGIAGANPTKFGVTGVAPEASFELHRVFGCEGSVAFDVAIKVSIAIYERGVDIITASIGGSPRYPEDPWATVVQRINQNGTYFQVSAGNSGPGYFTGTQPSIGIGVPAIGAVWNTETPTYLWNGTYQSGNVIKDITWVPGEGVSFPSTFTLWTASSVESDPINTGCGPYPGDLELPDFNSTVVLVSRKFLSPCRSAAALTYLASIGVKYTLWYNTQPDDPLTGPSVRAPVGGIKGIGSLPAAVGAKLFAAYQADRNTTVSLATPSSYSDSVSILPNTIAGGRMTGFSSWGITLDGRTFPTYSAPGGNILSIFPARIGGFGQLSGTSMAAPFAAGVAALLMQKHPDWDSKTVRNVLATTANPMHYNDNSTTAYDFFAPVAQQGGGLIDAYRALLTETLVDVASLSFNDTRNQPKSLSFNVKNIGSKAQTFILSHIPAASGYALSSSNPYVLLNDTSRELSAGLSSISATVSISPSSITILPGGSSTITVSLTPPVLDTKRLPLYGGYIALNSTDGKSLTVPYTGIATSLYDLPMDLSGSVLATYNASTSTAASLPPSTSPPVFTVIYRGSTLQWSNTTLWPCVLVSINTALSPYSYKIDLLNSTKDVVIPLFSINNYYRPGSTWYLDGNDGNNGTFLPEGEYMFRVAALKWGGTLGKAEDYVEQETDKWVLRYSKESVGLPGSAGSNSTAGR